MMDRNVQETVSALKERKLILYPTDTVWGIGCDATDEEAVKKVFALKKRSEAKSLVLLAADLDMVARYIKEIPQMAIQLVEVNDAPMTIIYPGAMGIAPSAVAQDGTVGIRIPMNDFCVEVIRRFGRPIVSTSANISEQSAPSCFAEISEEIKAGVDYTVDPSLEKTSTGKASQIIKIGLKGEVEIIRA